MNHVPPLEADVIIVGAGLSGLCCALELQEKGISCQIVEKLDQVGGRVRTDKVDDFLLDRGFQVLLTAYPEAQRLLDYKALDLQRFYNGALIHKKGSFHRVADPLRHPDKAFATLRAPIGSIGDKIRMLPLRRNLLASTLDDLFSKPETTTLDALKRRWSFSDRMIDDFFRPFIGGVTLDRSLKTSSRSFEFVMQMFSKGDAAVPAQGMQAIPEQLASRLAEGTIHFNTIVKGVDEQQGIIWEDGSSTKPKAIVVATEGPAASTITGSLPAPRSQSVACLYFSAAKAPIDEPVLMLNSNSSGLVNNVVVMSAVAPSYAPPGAALLSVSVLGTPTLDDSSLVQAVQEELRPWFGSEVQQWQHIKTYRITHALPVQEPPALEPPEKPSRLESGIFICGDHRGHASIQGAMHSGTRTAHAIANLFSR